MRWLCGASLFLYVAMASALDQLPWWKTAIFYQVYPRSFKDSDGDGVGDLKGITQMADYFTEIGVDAIWLSPIFMSPMADFGYDVSNYTEIDPIFGTMDDFEALKTKLRSIGVKLVLDFVPNHSSDEHLWFKRSVNTSDPLHEEYKDFYVWKDPKGHNGTTPIPPNNWFSVFSGSAWQWREERQQFYLHKFVKKQPDLNYRNPNVVANMSAIIDFWLDKGIDGFRMDAVQQLFENSSFPDEVPVPGTLGDKYANLQHTYEMNQPETFTMLRLWADLVYKWVEKDRRDRAVFLEVYDDLDVIMKYYGNNQESLEFPFNFELLVHGNRSIRPVQLKRIIDNWMTLMPKGGTPNWVIGNHDNGRIADRYGPEMVDALNLLTGVLPGIKVTYNGEEIGMQDTYIRWDQTVDPSGLLLGPDHYLEGSRDPVRTPMQWNNSISAGFSTSKNTWLPVNPNYWWLNVGAQRTAEISHLKVFKAMARARKDPVLQRGDLKVLVPNNDTLMVVRSFSGAYYVLIMNMGSEEYDYTSENLFISQDLDMDMTVVTSSMNTDIKSGANLQKGSLGLTLRPKAAVLLRSGYSASSSCTPPNAVISSIMICFIIVLHWR